MYRALTDVVLLALLSPMLWAQTEHHPSRPGVVYQNTEFGFRYRPPHEMRDETGRSTAMLEGEARDLHIKSKLKLLLSMSSGPDDSAVAWHSLIIVEYPRDAYSQLDDAQAKAKISYWVGGASGSDPASARNVAISRQTFSVFVFAVQQGSVRKGSVVWTTIRTGKLLSFAFAANSPEQLKALAESMKSVQFF